MGWLLVGISSDETEQVLELKRRHFSFDYLHEKKKNKQNCIGMALSFPKNNVSDNLRPLGEPPQAQPCLEHCLLQKFSMKEVSSESSSGTSSLSFFTHRGHLGSTQFFR